MDRLRWRIANLGHALFLAVWSMFWMSAAVVLRIVTGDDDLGLSMARRYWSPGLFFVARARLQVQGADRIDFSRPHVFVSNHESMIDIPAVFLTLPIDVRFIIKRELLGVPFLGWYCRAVGMIPVDRGDTAAAVQSLRSAGERIRNGKSILAFAEGTRSRDGEMLPFKKGAFVTAIEAGVPVVPMAIVGAREVLPSDGFRVRPGLIRIVIGAPIPTAGLTHDDRDALTERVRNAVVALRDQLRAEAPLAVPAAPQGARSRTA